MVQLNILGDVRTTDIALYSHGLGYEPKIMLAYGGRVLPSGYMIQNDGSGLNRTIAPWASSSTVYLREVAISSASTLGAVSRDYKLIVLRNAAPNPALPAMSGDGVDIQIGRGLIDSTKSYLRKVGVGDSPFSLDNDYGIDDNNGRLRTAAGGVVVTESGYGGSMVAPPFIQVGV